MARQRAGGERRGEPDRPSLSEEAGGAWSCGEARLLLELLRSAQAVPGTEKRADREQAWRKERERERGWLISARVEVSKRECERSGKICASERVRE